MLSHQNSLKAYFPVHMMRVPGWQTAMETRDEN